MSALVDEVPTDDGSYSPFEYDAADEPKPKVRWKPRPSPVYDPHCEHCGAEAFWVASAETFIHRYATKEYCGYPIRRPTEGRRVFERPDPPKKGQRTRGKRAVFKDPPRLPEVEEERVIALAQKLTKAEKPAPQKRWINKMAQPVVEQAQKKSRWA